MELNKIYKGNCLKILKSIENNSIDLIYMDPPFFTQRKHQLSSKNNAKKFEFSDIWENLGEYLTLIRQILIESKRVLKDTGSVFLHCDKTASHHLRLLLDEIFGANNFRSEIVWFYKRWSNAKKGLLNAHQNIYFYSKSDTFKFNTIYQDYSLTTNIDQILQERTRKKNGKSTYKRDEKGNVILGKEKKGVPLSDVWEIPYLNPKARERVGYPTQKPVLLLNQIITIASDENDIILDPFCGSGTTCVSAMYLNRTFIGIDVSKDAVKLAKKRLEEMVITESHLLKNGKSSYLEKTQQELHLLKSIGAFPVQRNAGIDGFLDRHFNGKPVPIKIQSPNETLEDAINKMEKASKNKGYELKIIIQTNQQENTIQLELNPNIKVIKSIGLRINEVKFVQKEYS